MAVAEPSGAPVDPLEYALAEAAKAKQWAVVAQLAEELKARRLAAAKVPVLADERAKRS
jgi:hypothetical protein